MTTEILTLEVQQPPRPQPVPTDGSDIESGKYFSSLRDKVVIERGGFFCECCLISQPSDIQSSDRRYCQFTYDILLNDLKDMRAAGEHRRFSWTPKSTVKNALQVELLPSLIVSTVNEQKNKVDTIQPTPPPRRGPKSHSLPDDKIRQLALAGLGSKAIASKLQGEGIEVSYKTIQRRLSK